MTSDVERSVLSSRVEKNIQLKKGAQVCNKYVTGIFKGSNSPLIDIHQHVKLFT